jgi:hypothetical protein
MNFFIDLFYSSRLIENRKILENLNNSKIARLVTVDPDNNQPYLIYPWYYIMSL